MKTLHQLWLDNGERPFKAVSKYSTSVHEVLAYRVGNFIGFARNERNIERPFMETNTSACWSLYVPPKKKKMIYPALFRCHGDNSWLKSNVFYSEDRLPESPNFVMLIMDRGIEIDDETT